MTATSYRGTAQGEAVAIIEPVGGHGGMDYYDPVSYTHLTLPTNREV